MGTRRRSVAVDAGPVLRVFGSVRPVPVGVRLLILLAGAVLVAVPHPFFVAPAILTSAGTVVAAGWPGRWGASVVTVGFLLAWFEASGWHGHPDVTRTLVAAAALYVVHRGCALAAVLPYDADVEAAVLGGWLLRTLPALAVAAAVVAADLLTPTATGTPLIELAGLVGVVAVVAVAVPLVMRRRPAASDDAADAAEAAEAADVAHGPDGLER